MSCDSTITDQTAKIPRARRRLSAPESTLISIACLEGRLTVLSQSAWSAKLSSAALFCVNSTEAKAAQLNV